MEGDGGGMADVERVEGTRLSDAHPHLRDAENLF
jgi:hypothetical protein